MDEEGLEVLQERVGAELTAGEQLELLSRYRKLDNELITLPFRPKIDFTEIFSKAFKAKCGHDVTDFFEYEDIHGMIALLTLIARQIKADKKCQVSSSDLEDIMINILRQIDDKENLTNYRQQTAKEMNEILKKLGISGIFRKETICD